MSRKFIYFINPISGTQSKASLVKVIEQKTTQQNIPFQILHTNAEGNYNYLPQKIAAEKITDIIICGGDGTVNQIINALLGVDVNIGIVPMGSGNGLAFAAKIPKPIHKALQIIFKGHTVFIDSFYINNKFSCVLTGIGFDAQVAHDFAKQKKRGLATYIKQSLKNFISAKSYPFSLSINETVVSTQAFFISIANSNQFGNNFTIAPKANLQDGLLDIVVVNKMNKLRMLWQIFRQISVGKLRAYDDKKYHRNKIHYFQTHKLIIQNPQLAPVHIDGEPSITTDTFKIEIINKACKLLVK